MEKDRPLQVTRLKYSAREVRLRKISLLEITVHEPGLPQFHFMECREFHHAALEFNRKQKLAAGIEIQPQQLTVDEPCIVPHRIGHDSQGKVAAIKEAIAEPFTRQYGTDEGAAGEDAAFVFHFGQRPQDRRASCRERVSSPV